MAGIASFQSSRWAIDGGVLVNTPVQAMIDAVLKMPASRQVRRVLADRGSPRSGLSWSRATGCA